jgi:hypothetical protein
MPVAGSENGQFVKKKSCDIPVKAWDDLISSRYRKASAGQKVVLHIHYDKGITGADVYFHGSLLSSLMLCSSHFTFFGRVRWI